MQSPMKVTSLEEGQDVERNINGAERRTMSAKMSDKFGVTDGVEDGVDDSGITKDTLRGCAQGVAGTAAHP